MKIIYVQETDTLTTTLSDAKIRESDEIRPGLIADFGCEGQIVRFKILSVPNVISQTKSVSDHQ